MGKRTCVFYGSDGKLTSSHVIGKTFLKALPGSNEGSRYVEGSIIPGHNPVHRSSKSDPRENKPNTFCGSCNSVWMERHESAVSEILLKLAKGESVTLTSDKRRKLAMWTMVACIGRASIADHDHIKLADRRELRERGNIPAGYQFWILQGEERLDWPTRFQWANDKGGNPGWVAWLWAGHVIVAVASPLWATLFEYCLGPIAPYMRHLLSGGSRIDWPLHPESFLSYEEFVHFSTL